jgi:hypothetical protein
MRGDAASAANGSRQLSKSPFPTRSNPPPHTARGRLRDSRVSTTIGRTAHLATFGLVGHFVEGGTRGFRDPMG